MKLSTLWNGVCLLLLGSHMAYSQVDVLTQHNDLYRTGWNNQETILKTANVQAGVFGKLYTRPVDDQMCTQPLVVTGISMPSVGLKNVVYVTTVNNSIYAYDADDPAVTSPYWLVNLTVGGMRPPRNTDIQPPSCGYAYHDFSGNFGIVGTPVIDKAAKTMYVVARSTDGAVFKQMLHALDITTGLDRVTPVAITASVSGIGDNTSAIINHTVNFDTQKENQRPSLLLLGGIVYIGYGSHCDWEYYHGWLLGYDAITLQQKIVFNTTPNAQAGGIWMSGAAPAADELGNIYVATGNGDDGVSGSNAATDPTFLGEAAIKLTPNVSKTALTASSFFRPYNFEFLDGSGDLDLGSTELMLIPNSTRAMTGCKNGNIYLMDRNNMGGYNSGGPDRVAQIVSLGPNASQHSSFAYYKGTTQEFVYAFSENTLLRAFPFSGGNTGLFGTPVLGTVEGPNNSHNGVFMSVSSNASTDTTSILWASHADGGCNANIANPSCPGILRAFSATDITKELWNSDMVVADNVGQYAKNVCPTIANGKVYLATFSNQLVVYGLTNNNPIICSRPKVALNKTATASSTSAGTPGNAFDGNLATSWTSNPTNSEFITVDLSRSVDLCGLVIHWGTALGKDFAIQTSNDFISWTTCANVAGNSALNDTIKIQATARYVRMQGITSGNGAGYSILEMEVRGTFANACQTPSNLISSNIGQNSVDLGWGAVPTASGYSIIYITAASGVQQVTSSSLNSVSLSGLACNTDYLFEVKAICPVGNSAYSSLVPFSTLNCGAVCQLPTRWSGADVGAVGVAGSSCYNSAVYTQQGAGMDIGGTADAFQYAYESMSSDEQITARVATLPSPNTLGKAGIMIRESLAADSRFAFIGVTGSKSVIFQTRNATGSNSVNTSGPNFLTSSYWIRLTKVGNNYSAYSSPDGLTWTQVGSTVNLGFGSAGGIFDGLSTTGASTSIVSSATIDNYSESSVVLPFKLQDFTANNIDNRFISLQWSTAMEQNNNYFEVQRSSTGDDFRRFAQVKAIGNSNTTQYYSAQDHSPCQGINYYRLKQVDLDGNLWYSPVILARFGQQGAPSVYPNPAGAFFTVVTGREPIAGICLFDVAGKLVKAVENTTGATSQTIYCGDLAQGIYIVRIKTNSQAYRQKLVIRH